MSEKEGTRRGNLECEQGVCW